jgi:hypothetical protein
MRTSELKVRVVPEKGLGYPKRDGGMFENSRPVKVAHIPNRHTVVRTQAIHLRDGSGRFAFAEWVMTKCRAAAW